MKTEGSEEITIFKYQSAEKILTEVLTNYTRKENEADITPGLNECKVVSLVSVPPNRDKFCFAFSYAYLLSERKKVLFIPLDLLPNPFLSSMYHSNPKLSEFIYYLKDNNSNINKKLKQNINCIDRLFYLAGLSHGFDLLSITKEDMSRWIDEIKNNAGYDLVVFFLGSFAEFASEAIRKSDKVLMTLSDCFDDKAVIKEMERQLNLIGIPMQTDKFQRMILPEQEWTGDGNLTLQELKTLDIWHFAMQYADRLYGRGDYGEFKR